jgi:hypothetical protein
MDASIQGWHGFVFWSFAPLLKQEKSYVALYPVPVAREAGAGTGRLGVESGRTAVRVIFDRAEDATVKGIESEMQVRVRKKWGGPRPGHGQHGLGALRSPRDAAGRRLARPAVGRHQVVSKRFVKKQQMRWTEAGAHLLL